MMPPAMPYQNNSMMMFGMMGGPPTSGMMPPPGVVLGAHGLPPGQLSSVQSKAASAAAAAAAKAAAVAQRAMQGQAAGLGPKSGSSTGVSTPVALGGGGGASTALEDPLQHLDLHAADLGDLASYLEELPDVGSDPLASLDHLFRVSGARPDVLLLLLVVVVVTVAPTPSRCLVLPLSCPAGPRGARPGRRFPPLSASRPLPSHQTYPGAPGRSA